MNRKITTRLDLNVGTRCNNKCNFCYHLDRLNEPFEDFDKLVSQLKIYRKKGINRLHITGGEPTLYKNLTDIVIKSKQLGFINIGIITNGLLLKKKSYVIECKNAGIDEFIISLHGHNAEIHDEHTQTKGSFDSIIKGIENLKELKIPLKINFVITRNNYKYLKNFAELMIELKPVEVALLYFNPLDYAANTFNEFSVVYTETMPFLNESLDLLEKHKIKVLYKFIPLCIISKGYEKYLQNFPNALFEEWEWNDEVRSVLQNGYKEYHSRMMINFKKFTKAQINNLPFKVLSYLNSVFCTYSFFYNKIETCNECKYDLICQGVNKYYLDLYGLNEFKPVKGDKIIKPDFSNKDNILKMSIWSKILNNILYKVSKTFYKNRA